MQGILLLGISMVLFNICYVIALILSKKEIITSYMSRKIVHITLGLIQMFLWAYYDDPENMSTRFYGCGCTLLYGAVFLIFGLELIHGPVMDFMLATVCRNGQAKEMIYGPFNYCVIVSAFALIFWTNYAPAVIGIMNMLTGDGFAEIIGKLYGKHKVVNPWGKTKTIEGSITVAVGGGLGAILMCLHLFGEAHLLLNIICGTVASVVEFYSPPNWDNVLIPLPALVLGAFSL